MGAAKSHDDRVRRALDTIRESGGRVTGSTRQVISILAESNRPSADADDPSSEPHPTATAANADTATNPTKGRFMSMAGTIAISLSQMQHGCIR